MSNLVFRNTPIPGRVLRFGLEGPESHAVITHFSGVNGLSEIRTGISGRPIEIPFLLFNGFRTRGALTGFLKNTLVDTLQNRNGILQIPVGIAGASPETFSDVTFKRYVILPPGPLPPGNLILAEEEEDDGWFCFLSLLFLQLKT